ncbi:unnamed protein product [Diatraea saccharalis]|uniref:Uncharacterized protein n=1 Tax=Diatraea saccharalis TaxID=40085 RepID=A0A9N9QX26_9NEOP|nr:unnamed protein product [Diatraea saccharalis]
MKFLVLALCVYAASGASFNNPNFGFKPWQTGNVARTTQTGGYAKATAQVSVPVTQTVDPVVDVAKTVVEPVVQVAKVVTPVIQESKVITPIVQSRGATPVVQVAKYATPYAEPIEVVSKDAYAEVLRSETEVHPEGFQYTYETSNGQYQYVGRDGVPVTVTYVADENGYQPQGDLLPVAPPVPVAIARALEFVRTHPSKVETVKNY